MALIDFQRAGHPPSFATGLSRHGHCPAALTAEGVLTYAELEARVRDATELLGPDRRLILLRAQNSVEALVVYLAALRGGHPVLLTDGKDTAGADRLIAVYDPDVIAGDTGDIHERRALSVHELHPDLAVLLSTSGSTGSPKLVRLSHQNLQSNAYAIAAYLRLTPEDRAITGLPMQYSYGLSVLNSHLEVGASLVFTDLSVVDRCFWELFRSTGVTGFAGVPHTFDLLDRVGFEAMSLPTLRYLTQAGGKMSPTAVRRYAGLGARDGWDLFVMYGQTEATARMAYLPPQLASAYPETIGVPIAGGAFAVDRPDEAGVGELVYRGDNVMLGYAESPADLALGATLSELRTGDLGRVTEDGLYQVVGRTSRFVKVFGLRIDLDEVERRVAEHGLTAACTGDDGTVTVAVEGAANLSLAAEIISRELGLLPSRVRVLATDRLPRLPGGKPGYMTVRAMHAGPASGRPRDGDPDRDPSTAVRDVFLEVLGVEPLGDDSFVSLGGDSLSYVEMSVCLEEALGALPRDWQTTPVRDLVPQARRRGFMARTDASALVRAISIVLIVGTHSKLWQLTGGAHALLVVAGFNFARFQLRSKSALASVARVAIPGMCWIGLVAAVSDKYGWPNALLVNGLVGRPQDQWGYWFLEALIQILLPLTAVLAVPAVSRFEQRRPFAVPLVAVVFGLLFRFDLIELSSTFPISRPHEVFWLFALGWAAARANSRRARVVVSAVALAALPGFFDTAGRALIVLAAVVLVTWVSVIPTPRPIQRLVAPLAGASLYIYLTHFQVYPPLQRLHSPLFAVVGSLVVGIVAWALARRVIDRCEGALRRWTVSPRRAPRCPAPMPR